MAKPVKEKSKTLDLLAIDLRRTDHEKIQRQLVGQMEKIGFLLLKNIPEYDEAEYLRACKAFHAMPEELKRKLYLKSDNHENSNVYRGYFPFKPNDPSHKEFYDLNMDLSELSDEERALPLYEEAPFPEAEEYKWIQGVFFKVRRVWLQTALRVLGYIAEGLNKDKEFFENWFEHGSLSTLRTIHYKPRVDSSVDSSRLDEKAKRLTTPEHTDSGFLTFLATFGYPGLEVLHEGVYKEVEVGENTIVVNLGATLAALTNNRLKATMHRVRDIGRERYSSPLFFEPKYSTRIPNGIYDNPQDIDACTFQCYGDVMIARMTKMFVEWENFEIPKDRVPYIKAVKLAPPLPSSV